MELLAGLDLTQMKLLVWVVAIVMGITAFFAVRGVPGLLALGSVTSGMLALGHLSICVYIMANPERWLPPDFESAPAAPDLPGEAPIVGGALQGVEDSLAWILQGEQQRREISAVWPTIYDPLVFAGKALLLCVILAIATAITTSVRRRLRNRGLEKRIAALEQLAGMEPGQN